MDQTEHHRRLTAREQAEIKNRAARAAARDARQRWQNTEKRVATTNGILARSNARIAGPQRVPEHARQDG